MIVEPEEGKTLNFIEQIIEEEIAAGKNGGKVHTRFPPEPNGYLHIGHATSICLNFGLAAKYNGACNLRFDDTNPSKEDVEFTDAIQEDIKWLGFQWDGPVRYASDYFQLYDWAEQMILEGKAYVDDQTAEEISAGRKTITEPGVNSPYRDRSVEENLDLFRRMKNGEFPEGSRVLRAKIDMAAVTRSCTGLSTVAIIGPVIGGASIRCTTLLMDKVTISKESLIRSVRWNLRFIGRFTIGFWIS